MIRDGCMIEIMEARIPPGGETRVDRCQGGKAGDVRYIVNE